MKWFVKNVMSFLPDYKLIIVGKGFELKRKELEKSNVEVIGTVDDISDYYYRYPVVVMPITYGAGMKVKTAAAMMYGRIIIGSDEALEGYDVDDVNDIYRCNQTKEWISTIKLIFEDDKHQLYSKEVRQRFLDRYENKKIKNEYDQYLDRILSCE